MVSYFFCGGKNGGGGVKISVGEREGMKNFFWCGRGDENWGWGVLGGQGDFVNIQGATLFFV